MSYSKKIVSLALAVMLASQSVAIAGANDINLDENTATTNTSTEISSENDTTNSSDTAISDTEKTTNSNTAIQDEIENHVFEGDTLPCSENDPSYHKFMNKEDLSNSTGVNFENDLTNSFVKSQTLFGSTIWGSKNLIHQDRFKNANKVFGIDVSYYQYDIDWTKVKNAGVKYVMIRVGYRGYGNGALVLDEKFKTYLNGAKAAGLDVGLYFYTQAINPAEAKEEANFVLNQIRGYSLEMPIYYDIENVDYDKGRLDSANLTKAQKTALCVAFCDTVKAAGYEPGVYANKSWFTYDLDSATLGAKYRMWLAHYTTSTDYTGVFDTWQYTGTGKIDGINTYVDINVLYDTDSTIPPTTPPVTSTKVTNFRKVSASQNKILMKWDLVAGATGYEIQMLDSATNTYKRVATTSSSNYKVTGLNIGKTYSFKVRPYFDSNATSFGDFSDVLKVSTSSKPTTPSNLKVNSISSTSCNLSWTSAVGATEYRIYRVSGSQKQQIAVTTSTNYTINNNSNYVYTVQAYRYANNKYYSSGYSNNVTVSPSKQAPSGFKVKGYVSNAVRVSWKEVSGATGYNVYLYKNNSFIKVAHTKNLEYRFSGLSGNTSYKIKVQSVYSNGEGPTSDAISISTRPSTPKSLKATSTTKNSISLSWNAVSGTSYYRIYMYDLKTGKYIKKLDVKNGTSCTITGLTEGSRYRFKIRSIRTTNVKNYLSTMSKNITVINSGASYYRKPSYTGGSLIEGLLSVGISANYEMQEKIAKVNGVAKYNGTASQNTHMLNLLKKGILIKP